MQKGKLSKRTWFNIVLYGLMGSVAWNVENMYFNTFLYNSVYAGVSQTAVDNAIPAIDAINLMVSLSAATAVLTAFIMGTLSDKVRKRKMFISIGYIAWGVVTGAFGLITRSNIASLFSLSDEVKILTFTVWTVIIMDCVMTFMGSTSNDSAFNAWVTEVTDTKSRQKVETVFAVLPVVAMGTVMVLGSLAQSGVMSYQVFFLSLGAVVTACGIIGLFTLKDPEYTEKEQKSTYLSDLLYGFKPSVIKENSRLYLALVCGCLYSVAIQVFFPYLLIYLQYIILPASENINLMSAKVIILAVVAVLLSVFGIVYILKLSAKNKKVALSLCCLIFAVGLIAASFVKDVIGVLFVLAPIIIGYAAIGIMINASIRDFTPKGKAGLFQGIRMIFYVLIPMVIGPALGSFASKNSGITYIDEYSVEQYAPTSHMFLYAGIVAALTLIPLLVLSKKGFEVEED